MERLSNFNNKKRSKMLTVLALVFCTTSLGGHGAIAAGDVARGEVLYQGCQDCHSIDKNDVGPMHKGVVGRASGTAPGYNYSPALRNAKIVWTEENLDKWLADPEKFIPGVRMFYNVPNVQDRADLIAFLKERAR
jgi:cytochrome c